MAVWIKPSYRKGEVDRAGRHLVAWWTRQAPAPQDLGDSYMVIDNWRSSHGLPLNSFKITLQARARRLDSGALVVQRLKRFSSVMNKLAREPHMTLSQMQDLGGCRAILSHVDDVFRLRDLYAADEKHPLFREMSGLRWKDYIQNPKADGYRGIHVIGRYHAKSGANAIWNGHRVEVQLRSRAQHAFATSVETVTTFTANPLKFGGGPEQWKRFFVLMGTSIALSEGCPGVEDAPSHQGELARELRELTRELRVIERLRGWAQGVRTLPSRNTRNYRWLLLVLDIGANTVKVLGFQKDIDAQAALSEVERRPGVGTSIDAVLVNVSRVRDLRRAYPNYYADTTEFVNAVIAALRKR